MSGLWLEGANSGWGQRLREIQGVLCSTASKILCDSCSCSYNIKDYKVRKNYNNSFREKFFEKFHFTLNKRFEPKIKENLRNKIIINADKITERVLLGSVILFPNLLNLFNKKFNSINFQSKNFNNIKNLILKLFNSKKSIEKNNLKTKLLSSGYQEIIKKLIDNSIYIHAPFLKFEKKDFRKVSKGWNEYWNIYKTKVGVYNFKNETEGLLKNLTKETYKKFRNLKLVSKGN